MSTGSLTPRRSGKGSRDSLDPDDMEDTRPLVAEERGDSGDSIPMCGCMSVKYYQPYFDVDTSDVTSRIKAALFFCRVSFVHIIYTVLFMMLSQCPSL
jgi:hypothetical protein